MFRLPTSMFFLSHFAAWSIRFPLRSRWERSAQFWEISSGRLRLRLLWRVVHNVVYLASFLVVGFLVTLIARQRDRMAEEIRRQRDEYERDLALAAQVQHRVLPKPLALPGIDIAAEMKTARLLGGDYYDFFPVSDDVVDLVIADVSGKGAAAALLMPSLAVALRLRARELEGPAEVIARPGWGFEADDQLGDVRDDVLRATEPRHSHAAIRQCRA